MIIAHAHPAHIRLGAFLAAHREALCNAAFIVGGHRASNSMARLLESSSSVPQLSRSQVNGLVQLAHDLQPPGMVCSDDASNIGFELTEAMLVELSQLRDALEDHLASLELQGGIR